MNNFKVGLTFAGGGAKGAYQVGVVKALAELKIPVHCISGASIGSLNGAMVAASPNMVEAYNRLDNVWTELSKESPLQFNGKQIPVFLLLYIAASRAVYANPALTVMVKSALVILKRVCKNLPEHEFEILESKPLIQLLEKYLDSNELLSGLPMYASIYESNGALKDLFNVLLGSVGISNTLNSEYKLIQAPENNQEFRNILLASAALPLLFSAKEINGKKYSDGGQGDWLGETGNIPVKPLVDAGCNTVIVCHLSNGSMWNRNNYPDVNVIEIRPKQAIARSSGFASEARDLLGFDVSKISSWKDQGYRDAISTLEPILKTLTLWDDFENTSQTLKNTIFYSGKKNINNNSNIDKIREGNQLSLTQSDTMSDLIKKLKT